MVNWMIAMGEDVLGGTPLGSRLPSAIFGVAGVLLLFLLGMELWDSVGWSALAAFLLAADGLHIVQSGIAMLDVFLTTFVTAGASFLVRDLRRMQTVRRASRNPAWITRWFGTRDRLLAGACLGAAVATKWSGSRSHMARSSPSATSRSSGASWPRSPSCSGAASTAASPICAS
jgi:dolichyl-phosphate-mannose--protein O-mannosyl transferase